MAQQNALLEDIDGSAVVSAAELGATLAPMGSQGLPKRLMDVALASILLILFAPLFCVLALLIKADGGPVFFLHRRVGRNGVPFRCIKFRSMCIDAEAKLKTILAESPAFQAEWNRDFKLRDDPRVTRIGRFLRKASLDELPQLFNVIKGEMSLVGPRPIVVGEMSYYGSDIGYYLSCRPGLTGLWQVSGRNDTTYAERVALDVAYTKDASVWSDALILLKTFLVVAARRGAY